MFTDGVTAMEIHNATAALPDEHELEHEVIHPRWWYAQHLRVAGASWKDIAEALGYQNADTAQIAVSKARRERSKAEMEDLIDLELERLDMLQVVQWGPAINGDRDAGRFILQVMAHRMKLLGLEKKPNEANTGTTNTAIFIGGDQSEYVKQLQAAREMVFNKEK